jgi:NADH dehydrogenase [ubiquinone] 1 alpha subcomplex assembly factor 7
VVGGKDEACRACRGNRDVALTPLRKEIAELIASEGPISVERYMRLASSHPRYGYYHARDPFGAEGDFITAPDISQMFGELIGLWAADCWTRMGRPERLNLVELGPGRGTLMADALRAARIVPAFRTALSVHLVETSERLRALQRGALLPGAKEQSASWPGQFLSKESARPSTSLDEATPGGVDGRAKPGQDDRITVPVFWHERFDAVPQGPLIIIANEFFDALPIRQYRCGAKGWRERLVGLDEEGHLAFGLSEPVEASLRFAAPDGAILEICSDGLALARDIGLRLVTHGGAALVIDYGHARQGFGDTLQAVRKHRFVGPLAEPGEADLTAHVDFAALGQAAQAAGARVHGPAIQGDFLRALGIEGRAQKLKAQATPAQAAAIDAALERLTGEGAGEMGVLFKAMAMTGPPLSSLAGFDMSAL